MAVGLVVLVAVAWLYLQDRQQVASSSTAATASPGTSDSPGTPASPGASTSLSTSASPSAPSYVARDAGEGGVKVIAAILTPGAVGEDATLADVAAMVDPATEIGFLVTFETHSGDLSNLDLVALSSLSAPNGDHVAVRWVSESDSGHHRAGVLVFERGSLDLAAGTGDLTLTMRDVAGVPSRTLTWLLPLG